MTILSADTPTHRRSIDELPSTEFEAMLERIRSDRMRLFTEYEARRASIMAARAEKITTRINNKIETIRKKFVAAEKLLDDIAKRVAEMRALELQVEDAIGEHEDE